MSAISSSRSRNAAVTALLVAALVAVSPHLLRGFPSTHAFKVNVFWYECFSEQLFAGELLPRWLFNYWGGLGAPVFYFYAPFPYYLFSLIDLLLLGDWGDLTVLSIGHVLLFFLSGAAFYLLVQRYVGRFWATACAIGYMLAPYHYLDLELRGVMGESSAYIWIPLILTGVLKPEKTWRTTVVSAFGYAGLALSHLPSALLAAPAIALFAVLSSGGSERSRAFGHVLVVGVLGTALSAFYVLPALMLRDTLPYDPWVTGQGLHFVATRWLIGSHDVDRFGGVVYGVLAGTSAVGLGSWAVHSAMSKSRLGAALERPPEHMARAILTVLCFCWFLMSLLSWPLWESLPFLSQVQFPWRLGVLIDVCSLLLVALFAPPVIARSLSVIGFEGRRRRVLESVFCIAVLGGLAALVIEAHFPNTVQAKSDIPRIPAIVEYRTRWLVESPAYLGTRTAAELRDIDTAPEVHQEGVRRWERHVKRLRPIAALRALRPKESLRIRSDGVTRATISASLESEATVRLKKIYYPHWRVTNGAGDPVDTHPDEQTGLLVFELPKGRHELLLERRFLPVEYWGMLISLLALLGVLVIQVRRHRAHPVGGCVS